MRTLAFKNSGIREITLVTEPADPKDDNVDVWIHLQDGRNFSFTVFSIQNLQSLLQKEPTFVSPGMLIVAELSDDLIIRALLQAYALGVENFGILQTNAL